ncbi:hypothetical protein ACE1CI_15290 [Aerosakkonemataceae cyanobacterium BLCC-F50]|uniref:DUF4352 domain-containing protein n=1 Tax=Floridaenema flaviceps BLCC-F50 TaxID=3153642 RepID=A0ABV4XSN5_9CYAN
MKASIIPILTAISLLCIACQSNLTQQSSTATTPNTQTPGSTTPKTSLPPAQTYDLQVNEDQVVARLTQIAFTDDSIVVTIAFTNVSQEAIQLNAKDDLILDDDVYDSKYRLAVPSDNPKIQIQPGTTLKGQFVFLGRVSPQATTLTIATNSNLPYWNTNTKNFPRISFSNLLIQRGK